MSRSAYFTWQRHGTLTVTYFVQNLRAMKRLLTFAVLWISVLVGSCTSPSNPAVTTLPLYGRVQLEDSTGNPIPPPYSGITVTLPGTNISVTADSLGHWTIPNQPPYPSSSNFVVSKSGFGTLSFHENESVFDTIGWEPPGFVVLTQAPDSIVHIEKVFCWDSADVYQQGGVLAAVTAKSSRVFLFVDTVPNIPSTGVHLSIPTEIFGSDPNNWVANDQVDIGYLGLRHGQTIYVSACAGSDAMRFLDSNNHEVLGNVGPSSNVYSVVFP